MLRVILFLATNFAVLTVLYLVLTLLGIGRTPAGTELIIFAMVLGFGGSLISLFISKWMAKRSMGVQIIEQPTTPFEYWLVDLVRRQSQQVGIGMPEVGIFDSPQPNAFATGWDRNNALVAVSTGLLQHMTKDEVEAVVGHEVSHVANGDMVTLTLIQGVLNTFVIVLARVIGGVVDQMMRGPDSQQSGPGIGYFLVSMIAQVLLSVLATIIVMWFSRYREFRADAGGAQLAGRAKMVAALQALQRQYEPADLPAGEFAAFGISGKIGSLFASHPPLAERIAALQQLR
ncbi:MAG: protease HtpX [Chromatiaceae bacterium]|nr:MAG: protease HtpX [Chromatiaceae bacterium]